ncbi:hypothetical protein AALO_G00092540 [Alosa alosa]|uniref:Uncharacterized protein n=1 Tax=Alosa alosa TaxID=278164 RepID=A0AAV6GVF8_9TELE|nr:hypothetical protein AALO_G00092540 [Alosa alosa]
MFMDTPTTVRGFVSFSPSTQPFFLEFEKIVGLEIFRYLKNFIESPAETSGQLGMHPLTSIRLISSIKCVNTDPEGKKKVVKRVPVAILTVYEDDDAAASATVTDIAVILEGAVILHDLPDFAAAFACLFSLLYAMNINYPEQMRYTFEAIQNIFFDLGSRCSQHTRSLKEKLLL